MKNRTFIGFVTDNSYDFKNRNQDFGIPATYLYREFKLNSFSKVKISVAVLGVYSLYVNGYLVNDEIMSQDCTEYGKRITYRDFNITKFLKEGINRVGFILGDGWYASNLSHCHKNIYGDYPLKVCYEILADGNIVCESDGNELASTGAIRGTDNQNGIIIDNNLDCGDFSNPSSGIIFPSHVSIYHVDSKIEKSIIPPVKKDKAFQPTLVYHKDNEYIFDFKQNITGVIHSIFNASKLTEITIYHGEVLTRNGDLYLENLRSAKAIDRYTLSGIGDEEFLPRHTFHGFRYIKIVIKGSANIKFLEAIAYRSRLKRIGKIRTSNSLVNKIYSNIIWSQKDNNLSIPTDCPQRDERMGWTGDAQVFAETACYNFKSHKFLKNYCNCLMDSMDEVSDGVPVFSPFFHRLEEGKPICAQGWSDAIIIIPYTLYLYYGDKAFLRKTLPYMKRYLKYVRKHCLDNNGLYDSWSFGDWLSVFEETDKQFYDNCYYAYDNYLISRVCNILGNKSEQEFYQRYLKSKQLTRNKYMHNDGTIANDTQGAYVLAYKLKIASLEEVKDNIVRKVEQFGHLTTGFHSTKSLLPLLSEIGRSDLAYNLLLNKKYPSWGYEISCGATTIWERWDSYRKDVGFNPDGMNSFNHYSLGAVGEWMYQYMMGIRPNENLPAFKKTLISPYFDRRITHFKGSYKSNSGLIEVEYKILNDQVFYNIKADHNIELEFRFKNPVISKIESKDNSYQFVIAL